MAPTKSETASRRTGASGASSAKARRLAKLQQFNTEFESRIVEPVVERRTALATSAQLGADDEVIPRLPDVCDQVAGFLARIQQKLEPAQAVPLLLSCAERLAELREHSFAVDRFYNRVLALCDELRAAEAERGAAALAAPGEEEDEDDEQGALGREDEEARGRARARLSARRASSARAVASRAARVSPRAL